MEREERRERLRAYERHVAGNHEHRSGKPGERVLRHLHRVTGALLLALLDELERFVEAKRRKLER
jgi:hypothetical protein